MQSDATDATERPWGRDPLPRFYSVMEVAERLGVDEATIYRGIQRGEVPAVQLGGRGAN